MKEKNTTLLLERYSDICAAAGDEPVLRDAVRQDVAEIADEVSVNPLGNLTVTREGKNRDRSVLLSAHMDEVACIVRSIEKNGLIRFSAAGGIVPKLLPGNAVIIGRKRVPGVITCKSYHLMTSEEKKKAPVLKELFIDVGAGTKDDVNGIKPGDYVYFTSRFFVQNGKYFGKAFDDRAGCAALTEILHEYRSFPPEVTLLAVYTAQEEVGLRGAATAAFGYQNVLFNVNLEGTTCADREQKKTYSPSTEMGRGPAVTFMDKTTITQRTLLDFVISVAERHSIPFQLKKTVSGGTDAGMIHLTEGGIPSVTVSLPVRYIHGPWGVVSEDDFTHYLELAKAVIREAARFCG